MAIYAPGRRNRHNKTIRSGKRAIVAFLSLTAMVDMFTVIVVFLLQNYNSTGEVIEISDQVKLPKASQVKELLPAHVVVVSRDSIILDKDVVGVFQQIKEQQDWKIVALFDKITEKFKESEAKKLALTARLRDAVQDTKPDSQKPTVDEDKRITIQADKSVDFLTIKKVMFTLTEAGASEINFAVIKNDPTKPE
jgi:biopolymer transport protein ExbD